jgi:hypothetical protein
MVKSSVTILLLGGILIVNFQNASQGQYRLKQCPQFEDEEPCVTEEDNHDEYSEDNGKD